MTIWKKQGGGDRRSAFAGPAGREHARTKTGRSTGDIWGSKATLYDAELGVREPTRLLKPADCTAKGMSHEVVNNAN